MSVATRFAVHALVLVISAFAFLPSLAADDIYLRCSGALSIFRSRGVDTVERQEIVAHLKGGRITFSGNASLLGKNIEICTPSDDELYFDSESCRGQTRTDPRRIYGTLNRITGALTLTNQSPAREIALIDGRFKCATVIPAVK